jgi:hypothetical protein
MPACKPSHLSMGLDVLGTASGPVVRVPIGMLMKSASWTFSGPDRDADEISILDLLRSRLISAAWVRGGAAGTAWFGRGPC